MKCMYERKRGEKAGWGGVEGGGGEVGGSREREREGREERGGGCGGRVGGEGRGGGEGDEYFLKQVLHSFQVSLPDSNVQWSVSPGNEHTALSTTRCLVTEDDSLIVLHLEGHATLHMEVVHNVAVEQQREHTIIREYKQEICLDIFPMICRPKFAFNF